MDDPPLLQLKEESPEEHNLRWEAFVDRRIPELLDVSYDAALAFCAMVGRPAPMRPPHPEPVIIPHQGLRAEKPILQIRGRNLFGDSSPELDQTDEVPNKKRKTAAVPPKRTLSPNKRHSGAAAAKTRPLPDGKKLYETFKTIDDYVNELQSNKSAYFPGTAQAGIFHGLRIMLVSRSPKLMSIGPSHLVIQNLVRHGARIQHSFQSATSSLPTTHIVALNDTTMRKSWWLEGVAQSLGLSLAALQAALNGPLGVKVVNDTWVGSCIGASTIMPEGFHQIKAETDLAALGPSTSWFQPVQDDSDRVLNVRHIVPPRQEDATQDSTLLESNPETRQIPQPASLETLASANERVAPGTQSHGFEDLGQFLLEAAAAAEVEAGHPSDEEAELDQRRKEFITDLMILSEKAPERDSNDEAPEEPAARRQRHPRGYQCERSNVGGERDGGVNDDIVRVLKKLKDQYEASGDHWRTLGMTKAIGILRNSTTRIATFDQATAIPGIGAKNALKIAEIARTGELRRLKMTKLAEDKYLKLFAGIWGVGSKMAKGWYNLGARTLDDLRPGNKFGIELSAAQKLGLEHYDDLKIRIPRSEAESIYEVIKRTGKQVDPAARFELMGSYRRGQETCGDIDIIVTRDTADGKDHTGIVRKMVDALSRVGLITATLSAPTDWDAPDAKWMGLCHLPSGRIRHMDILAVPFEELGAALLYFTGNDIFNRSLRLKARHMGYSLNHRGLFKNLLRDPKTKFKVTHGERIAGRTEEDIFTALNVKWRWVSPAVLVNAKA